MHGRFATSKIKGNLLSFDIGKLWSLNPLLLSGSSPDVWLLLDGLHDDRLRMPEPLPEVLGVLFGEDVFDGLCDSCLRMADPVRELADVLRCWDRVCVGWLLFEGLRDGRLWMLHPLYELSGVLFGGHGLHDGWLLLDEHDELCDLL